MARSYLPSLFGRDGDSIGALFREVEKTFEDFARRAPFGSLGEVTLTPQIDVSESNGGLDVTAELPGVEEKDVDVSLADGVLTIRGEKKAERDEKDKGKNWHIIERSYGSFSRSIRLPFDPDMNKVEAKFDKGVLRVHLPKSPEAAKKEKKIEIRKA
jgi:HSP20 family protein